MKYLGVALACLMAAFGGSAWAAGKNDPAAKTGAVHPLAPLSAAEVQQAVKILKDQGKVTPATRFVSIALKEPRRDVVNGGQSQKSISREAFVVLFDNGSNRCYEAALSLTKSELLSYKHIPDVQPTMTIDEQIECEKAVLASAEFKAALKKHYGTDDTRLVMVDIWSAGYYGVEEEKTKRLARPLCFLRTDPTDNGYARPIEGIRPVVDLNTMKVIRVEDYGRWPLPPQQANYAAERMKSFRTGIKPLEITQPDGPSFQLDGNQVRWQNWSFVVGFNAREGLTLHQLRYRDNGKARSILHRASLSEMVVPYGDPGPTNRYKNAFDVGEYGMGMCANSLEPGCDCVGHVKYLDAHLCSSRGEPLTIKNAVCLHEEDNGILWKHTDRRLNVPEARRSRRLVVSSISTVENYEYGFYWYLYQDGTIQYEVKLTGCLSVAAVKEKERPKHGNLVAPQLYAPNHQHFFNVRLDFDLDGPINSVHQVDIVPDEINDKNPFENAFHARSTLLKSEKQARSQLNLESGRTWRITNPKVLNGVGEPVAYRFIPGENATPMGSKNAWWRKRAGFVNHHVWVTPNRDDEKYGAGDYPNQSTGGDGLIRWTEQDRPIAASDIVFWYTMGHTHIPRPEDYPVMPAASIGFMLRPSGFFDQNPANDLPPPAKKIAAR